ncbi:hypothetical protein ACFSYD_23500 [Paracoccus aerius]
MEYLHFAMIDGLPGSSGASEANFKLLLWTWPPGRLPASTLPGILKS